MKIKYYIIGVLLFAFIISALMKPSNAKANSPIYSNDEVLGVTYNTVMIAYDNLDYGDMGDWKLVMTYLNQNGGDDYYGYVFLRTDLEMGLYTPGDNRYRAVFSNSDQTKLVAIQIEFRRKSNGTIQQSLQGAMTNSSDIIFASLVNPYSTYSNLSIYVDIENSQESAQANMGYLGLNENGSENDTTYIDTLSYPQNIQVDLGLLNRGNNEMDVTWDNPILYRIPNFGGVDMTQTKLEIGVGFLYKPLTSSDEWVDMSNLTGIPVLDTALDIITLPIQIAGGGKYAMVNNPWGSIGNQSEYFVDYLVLESVGASSVGVNYFDTNETYNIKLRDAFINHSEFIANNFTNAQDGWDVIQGFHNQAFEFMFVTLRYYNVLSDGSIIYGDTAYHWFDGTTNAYIQDVVLPNEDNGSTKMRSMVQSTIDKVNGQITEGEIYVDVNTDTWEEWLTTLPSLLANMMKGILAIIKTVAVVPMAIGSVLSFLPYEVNALIKFGMFFLVIGGIIKWLKS